MTRTKSLAMVLIGGLLATACGLTDPGGGGDQGGGDDGSGGDNGGGGGDGSGGGGGGGGDNNAGGTDGDAGQPTYPTQHPKIYLAKNKARLKAALDANTPAASRFKAVVDRWQGGADVYAFQAWNGALIGQAWSRPHGPTGCG